MLWPREGDFNKPAWTDCPAKVRTYLPPGAHNLQESTHISSSNGSLRCGMYGASTGIIYMCESCARKRGYIW